MEDAGARLAGVPQHAVVRGRVLLQWLGLVAERVFIKLERSVRVVGEELVPEPGVNLWFDVGWIATLGRQKVKHGAIRVFDGYHAPDARHVDGRLELLAAGLLDGGERCVEARDRHGTEPVPSLDRLAVLAGVEDAAEVAPMELDDAVATIILDVELPTEQPSVELAGSGPVIGHQVVPDELAGNLRCALLIDQRRKCDAAIAPRDRRRTEDGGGDHEARVSDSIG